MTLAILAAAGMPLILGAVGLAVALLYILLGAGPAPATNKAYDTLQVMKAAGAIASSAAVATIIDLGAAVEVYNQRVEIDVTALEIDSDNETYDIVLQGSTDSDFGTAANIVELAALHLGAKETKRTDSDADDATGRYKLPFTNWRNGAAYRYLRLYTVVGGAGVTTGINYSAYITKD